MGHRTTEGDFLTRAGVHSQTRRNHDVFEALLNNWVYLWLCQNSYWKWPIYSGFTYSKWWFSIVMLVYQRVSTMNHNDWLVVDELTNSSENSWTSSVGMMTFPIYGQIKIMFQTTNQMTISLSHLFCSVLAPAISLIYITSLLCMPCIRNAARPKIGRRQIP